MSDCFLGLNYGLIVTVLLLFFEFWLGRTKKTPYSSTIELIVLGFIWFIKTRINKNKEENKNG